jgi:hypothetical protein
MQKRDASHFGGVTRHFLDHVQRLASLNRKDFCVGDTVPGIRAIDDG